MTNLPAPRQTGPFPTPPHVTLTTLELQQELAASMLKIFTREQAEQLLALCARIQARAVERGAEQSVTIIFNGKSWPVHFNGTDNEKPIRPTNYQAE